MLSQAGLFTWENDVDEMTHDNHDDDDNNDSEDDLEGSNWDKKYNNALKERGVFTCKGRGANLGAPFCFYLEGILSRATISPTSWHYL